MKTLILAAVVALGIGRGPTDTPDLPVLVDDGPALAAPVAEPVEPIEFTATVATVDVDTGLRDFVILDDGESTIESADPSAPAPSGGLASTLAVLAALFMALPMLGTALSADRISTYKDWGMVIQSYPVNAASVIYKGALVVIDAEGYLRPAVDTAGFRVVGIAAESVTGGAADGDVECKVISGILVELEASSIAQTDVPNIMYVVDDQTFDETSPLNNVKVGRLHAVTSSTRGWVHIPPGGTTE